MGALSDHLTPWEAERVFAGLEDLGRIATALERIADALEREPEPESEPIKVRVLEAHCSRRPCEFPNCTCLPAGLEPFHLSQAMTREESDNG